jgi:hypothetical protein
MSIFGRRCRPKAGASLRQRLLQRVVDFVFPTNRSGNSVSRS